MANVVNKIFTDRMGGRKASEYIGIKGDLFYDSDVGDIRVSDGVTPGGKPTGGGETTNGIYRGYQAGVNIFRQNSNARNQNYNGEFDMAQIFIHDAEGRVDYINYTRNTDKDDFYVTGLQHNDQIESENWSVGKVIALNVYSKSDGGLTAGDLRTFVRKFIDTVLYTDQDQQVNDAQIAKNLFYDNIEILKQSLPAEALFDNFYFADWDRLHNPEYNMIHADGSTESGNYSANFIVRFNDWWNPGEATAYDNITNTEFLNAGTGYSIGDKLTANGGQMGGNDGANDFTLTVTALKSGNITELNMTSGGTGFHPHNWNYEYNYTSGGNGNDAAIHIRQCDSNGVITSYEVRNGGGYNYQVGDTLTLNYGGDDATFEVVSVGTNGIADWNVEGTPYVGSPAKVPNGAWPSYYIGDGSNDQYDGGNVISTDLSSHSFIADFNNNKMTITNTLHSGTVNLARGMFGIVRNPDDITEYSTFWITGQASDGAPVWYVDTGMNWSGAQVRIDGINYNSGAVAANGAFGLGEGVGQYVVTYDQSIFALMAFNIQDVNSVYYNGETGVDTNGTKSVEVLLGSADGVGDSKLIQQRLIWDSEYTLQTIDIGKHIYNPNGDNTIYIPIETAANFPVGSAITFVSTQDNPTWISRENGDLTQVWGAGFNQQSNWWAIPPNSMGTILKIGPEKWIVSGAGLYNDD